MDGGSLWPAGIRARITERIFTLVSWLCPHVGYYVRFSVFGRRGMGIGNETTEVRHQ